jgi:hypothetical protein
VGAGSEGKVTKGEKANLLGFALCGLAAIFPPALILLAGYTLWYATQGGIGGIDDDNDRKAILMPSLREIHRASWFERISAEQRAEDERKSDETATAQRQYKKSKEQTTK